MSCVYQGKGVKVQQVEKRTFEGSRIGKTAASESDAKKMWLTVPERIPESEAMELPCTLHYGSFNPKIANTSGGQPFWDRRWKMS